MNKNDILTVKIDSLGYNGEGICKSFEKPIFIPFALKDELVEIIIIKVTKDYYVGKLKNIIKSSQFRIEPKCEIYKKCGGCQLQHLIYEKQLEFKAEHIKDCFKKIAKMEIEIDKTVPSENIYNYRNKLSLPIGMVNNNIEIGMFAEFSHRLIPIDKCAITEDFHIKLLKAVKNFAQKNNISIYSEETKKGLLKHLVARKIDNQISVTIVINGNDLPKKLELKSILEKTFENYEINLTININKLCNNVILGDEIINISGNEIFDNFMDLKTSISPKSFYQVNNYIKQKIYERIINEVDKEKDYDIIDAYSGAGTMSNIIAKHLKNQKSNRKVYGIEIVEPAVKSATQTAKENNIDDIVTHILGDCAEELPKLIKTLNKSIVILDPPRKGANRLVMESLIESQPDKIFYISCDPSTLARDIAIIKNHYEIISVTPYDMFPNTKHIETLAILKKL